MIEMPQEENREVQEMMQRYRNVFGTSEGRKVLGDILTTCHYGVPLNGEVERIEYNLGIYIARMSGAMNQVDVLLGIGEE